MFYTLIVLIPREGKYTVVLASNIFSFIRPGEHGETSIRKVTTHTHHGMFICLAR